MSASTINLKTPLLARKELEVAFGFFSLLLVSLALLILMALIVNVALDGAGRLNWSFLTSYPSRFAHKAGILSSLVGSFYLIVLTAVLAIPLGIGGAIYLEEYASKSRFAKFIELNIANLAGVPSVIYGLLGLQLFVRLCHFERSLLAGASTLALLILPIIIIATREALRTVPNSIREGSLALGATKWQTVRSQVMPVALPGIMTGCILAFSRAMGETAPLVTLGALTYIAFMPDGIFSPFTALPIQAFNWISRPHEAFHENAAAAIVVLLVLLLMMNGAAILLRLKFQKRGSNK